MRLYERVEAQNNCPNPNISVFTAKKTEAQGNLLSEVKTASHSGHEGWIITAEKTQSHTCRVSPPPSGNLLQTRSLAPQVCCCPVKLMGHTRMAQQCPWPQVPQANTPKNMGHYGSR